MFQTTNQIIIIFPHVPFETRLAFYVKKNTKISVFTTSVNCRIFKPWWARQRYDDQAASFVALRYPAKTTKKHN